MTEEAYIISLFHKKCLNDIKKDVKECTYISFLNKKMGDSFQYYIKVHLKNNTTGVIDKFLFEIETHPSYLTKDNYLSFSEILKNKVKNNKLDGVNVNEKG